MGPEGRRIRVLLVDDSLLYRTYLRELLRESADIEVVGEAANGKEAIQRNRELRPDLILTDVVMPVMDGLTAIRAERGVPILVLTAATSSTEQSSAFDALEAGALDVVPKPDPSDRASVQALVDDLPVKIRALSRIRVVQRAGSRPPPPPSAPPPPSPRPMLVLIGSSTGGPQAMSTILRRLPVGFPAPVLVVQHIAHGFLDGLTSWLARECHLPIQIAVDGTVAQPGRIYFAPTRKHMRLQGASLLRLNDGPPVNGCKPSVDVLFQSACDQGRNVVAVVLTGMGHDGLDGAKALARVGARVLVQSPESCTVPGMPSAIIEAGQAHEVLEPEDLADTLVRLASLRR